MVNCYRKTKSPSGIHFSLFTFHFSFVYVYLRPFASFAKFAFGYLSFRAKRRISFLFRGGIPHGVRNDKLMVNCQWLIVIGKRKVLRVFIFHFSLFTFRSFMCICVHSRHLRNLRSDNPTPHKKRANTEVRPYTAYRTLNADG